MFWFYYAEFILLPLIFSAEVTAFALLYRHRNKRRNKHQIYLIAALCISEFNGIMTIVIIHIMLYKNVSLTLLSIFWVYLHLFVRFTYYSAMTLLTIDRFLVFYLNIRYLSKWPPEKLLKSIAFIYVTSLLIFICFACAVSLKLIDWMYFTNIMYMPYFIWDVIYIIQVIATYFYIYFKYKKHKELIEDQKLKVNNKEHFKLLTPTLLIVTFIIFYCIPDFVNIFYQFYYFDGNTLICNLLGISYRISWLIDPILYIYHCKLISKTTVRSRTEKS